MSVMLKLMQVEPLSGLYATRLIFQGFRPWLFKFNHFVADKNTSDTMEHILYDCLSVYIDSTFDLHYLINHWLPMSRMNCT